jgi:hypothetical protein
MRDWGHRYPDAGYGGRFYGWLRAENPQPYNSWGNGSAMRVSPAGWLYPTLEKTRAMARLTADVTHNHPEGIRGAEAAAGAIFLARTGHTKEEIRDYAVREIGYDLSRTCDEIRPGYHHVESCQQTVPEALTAFLEGNDFEDVIRTAVSLGGDCDTLTCIAGSIAEAFYGVLWTLKRECMIRLPADMLDVLYRFDAATAYKWTQEEILSVSRNLLEELRDCEDGTVTTTCQLLSDLEYNVSNSREYSLSELFEIHNKLWRMARENSISLTSLSKGIPEGLPFFLDFVVRNKKAKIKCPFCGSTSTAQILYGLPLFSEKLEKQLEEGKLTLGGCCIKTADIDGVRVEVDPTRKCNKCKKKFGTPPVLLSKDRMSGEYYSDIITSIEFEVGGYFGGYTKTTVSKDDKGATVTVTKPYEDESTAAMTHITLYRWNKLINRLYEYMFVHEWKKKYVDPDVLDGTQWSLDIEMTGRRKRSYYGSNKYPPCWEELIKAFKEIAYARGGKATHPQLSHDSYQREAERDSKSSRFPGIVTMEDTLEEYEALYGDIYQLPDPERAIRKLIADGFFERHPEMADKILKTNKKPKKKT